MTAARPPTSVAKARLDDGAAPLTISAAAIIEALQRRWRLTAHRARAPGEFPEGWATWLGSMTQRADAVTGARVEEVLAVLAARPLPLPPGRTALLSRWQAFSTLWRQQWHRAPREDRHVRWAAAAFSVLVNLFFAIALVWLMYLRYLGVAPPPQGEDVVQVEFVGEGTPDEMGGGVAPDSPSEDGDASSAASQVRDATSPPEALTGDAPPLPPPSIDIPAPPTDLVATPLDIPDREVATPIAPAVPQEQAVAVSEPAPEAPEVFVLPPTRRLDVAPRTAAPELQARTLEVREREVAAPVQAPTPVVKPITPAVRALTARTQDVVEREVTAPVQAPMPRTLEVRTPAARDLSARTQTISERDVRAPVPAAATPSARPSTPAGAPAGTPAAARPPAVAPGSSPGTGPKAQAAPGTWATPARADDWGASARNTPGAERGVAPGVFNADGSVRVAEGPGSAAPGMPPGAVTQEIANLDRAGTWLKRKPNDFEATSFDKFWVPNETLLAEWVRKSIKEVLIPIPGTNKRIRCAVALLALGGACAISDPNLNEQPATARPPPPVPFKPHLQEDNGSIRPATPPGG